MVTRVVDGSSSRAPQTHPPLTATGWTLRPTILAIWGPVAVEQSGGAAATGAFGFDAGDLVAADLETGVPDGALDASPLVASCLTAAVSNGGTKARHRAKTRNPRKSLPIMRPVRAAKAGRAPLRLCPRFPLWWLVRAAGRRVAAPRRRGRFVAKAAAPMAASNSGSVVVEGKLVIARVTALAASSRPRVNGRDSNHATSCDTGTTHTLRSSCGSPNCASLAPARQTTGVVGWPLSTAMYMAMPWTLASSACRLWLVRDPAWPRCW